MSTTVQATVEFNMTAKETLSESLAPGVSARSVTHSAFNVTKTLNGDSDPPVAMISELEQIGNGTINLAALPLTGGGTGDATGLKLQALRIHNRSTANALEISEGASNGYGIGGDPINVPAGGVVQHFFNDKLGDIASGDRTLDIVFAPTQEADITLLLG